MECLKSMTHDVVHSPSIVKNSHEQKIHWFILDTISNIF